MESKIRVVNIVTTLNPTSGVVNVLNTFQKEIHPYVDYDFIYFEESEYNQKIDGCRYLKLSLKKIVMEDLSELEKLREFIRDDQTIVHNHELLYSHLLVSKIRKIYPQIKIIGHAHSSNLSNKLFKRVRNKFLIYNIEKYYDAFWGCSEQAIEAWFSKNKIKTSTSVIFNPIDCKLIKKTSSNMEKKETDKVILGHVGRLSIEKNHVFLLEIARELLSRKIDFKMIFIGNGSYEQQIRDKVCEYRLSDNIVFIPYLDKEDLYQIMLDFDIFLFPSKFEGLGTSLIEAQALGIPSLANITLPKETDLGMVDYIPLKKDKWVEEILKIADSECLKKSVNRNRLDKFCQIKSSEELLKKYRLVKNIK